MYLNDTWWSDSHRVWSYSLRLIVLFLYIGNRKRVEVSVFYSQEMPRAASAEIAVDNVSELTELMKCL